MSTDPLYFLARRFFAQETRSKIKQLMASSRKQFAPVHLLLHEQFTAKQLVAECAARMPGDFDILMVHSASDRLLPMYSGTPKELVLELLELCGPKRTLAMPAFNLGGKYYQPIEYYRTHIFDVRRTISEMGMPSEVFRRMPGVRRSLHPTHSVCAFGPLAEELTSTHHLGTTRTGKHTPFEVMAKRRTVILGLGIKYFRSMTQSKCAEDLFDDDFPVKCLKKDSITVRMIDSQGQESSYVLTIPHLALDKEGTILRTLMPPGHLNEWRFHGVNLWLASAREVTECLLDAALRGITFYGHVHGEWRVPPERVLAARRAICLEPGDSKGGNL